MARNTTNPKYAEKLRSLISLITFAGQFACAIFSLRQNASQSFLVKNNALQLIMTMYKARGYTNRWIEKDGRAMGTLLGFCTQEMAIHIESSKSPADIWKILAGIANSADTETRRDLLFREFIDIKAIPREPLSNFFGKLQETVGHLAGTDHQISPYHHRTQLLRNLPVEYDMARTIIEDKSPQSTIQQILKTLKQTEKELDTRKR